VKEGVKRDFSRIT